MAQQARPIGMGQSEFDFAGCPGGACPNGACQTGACPGGACGPYGCSPTNPKCVRDARSFSYTQPNNLRYPAQGMPGGAVVYPYYTHKGPSDFFRDDPSNRNLPR